MVTYSVAYPIAASLCAEETWLLCGFSRIIFLVSSDNGALPMSDEPPNRNDGRAIKMTSKKLQAYKYQIVDFRSRPYRDIPPAATCFYAEISVNHLRISVTHI
jgi:hypothetical protein